MSRYASSSRQLPGTRRMLRVSACAMFVLCLVVTVWICAAYDGDPSDNDDSPSCVSSFAGVLAYGSVSLSITAVFPSLISLLGTTGLATRAPPQP